MLRVPKRSTPFPTRRSSDLGDSNRRTAMFVFLFARASHRSITTRLDAIERRGRGDAKRNVRFRIVSKSTSADLESVGPQTNRRGTSRRNTLAGIVRLRKTVKSL